MYICIYVCHMYMFEYVKYILLCVTVVLFRCFLARAGGLAPGIVFEVEGFGLTCRGFGGCFLCRL